MKDRFPLSQKYNPEWVKAGVSGGANPLYLTEWLASAMELKAGMRVLDLGCGRGVSSIFLHREFGVEVWSVDLWFDASERWERIREAGAGRGVFPIRADARALPFAAEFFDAIVSIDSFPYYGTDDHYLNSLARFLKAGGKIGIAGAGLMKELDGPTVPEPLRGWWEPSMYCLHSASWWRRHWERTGIVEVSVADTMAEGWRVWSEWQREIAPENLVEIDAVESDGGETLGYLRVVGRRRVGANVEAPVESMAMPYVGRALLREG